MRPWLAALILAAAAGSAHAQDKPLPSCSNLVVALKDDPSSILNGSALLSVENLVADPSSTGLHRLCTGVANYRDATSHISYTANWKDESETTVDVNAHPTTSDEAKGRAVALRNAYHTGGQDGTYAIVDYTPYCADDDFATVATHEMNQGISTGEAFYLEPGYKIFSIAPNGPGSGILANCLATVGNDQVKGDIFIGTNWVNSTQATIYQFYILEAGPDGFKLANRLWDLKTE